MGNTRRIVCLGISGLLLGAVTACSDGEEADGNFSGSPLVALHLGAAGLHIEARSSPQPPRKGLVDIELRVASVEGKGDGGHGGHDDGGHGCRCGGHGGHGGHDHEGLAGHGGHDQEGHAGHAGHDESHGGHGGGHHHDHGGHALVAGKASGLAIRVIPWMGEHGHGSNEVEAEEVEAGVYLARGVLFSMPGTWALKLAIEGIEKEATSASFEVLP